MFNAKGTSSSYSTSARNFVYVTEVKLVIASVSRFNT